MPEYAAASEDPLEEGMQNRRMGIRAGFIRGKKLK